MDFSETLLLGPIAISLTICFVVTGMYLLWRLYNSIRTPWLIEFEELGDFGGLCDATNVYVGPEMASYKGKKVFLHRKQIDLSSHWDLNRTQKAELDMLAKLQHQNLVKIFGFCLNCPDMLIVTEQWERGTLTDLCASLDGYFNAIKKIQIADGLSKGLQYIHNSKLVSHGRLKSSSCKLTARWEVKITDFGLNKLDKLMQKSSVSNFGKNEYREMLWSAPELLRMSSPPRMGTQKGDIYSFAIILHEMLYLEGVFGINEQFASSREIIEKLKNPFGDRLRPRIDRERLICEADAILEKLMLRCWTDDPEKRPDIAEVNEICDRLNTMDKGDMMVDYQKKLEAKVLERTRKLQEERESTEKLVHKLLPVSVAKQLMNGNRADAETSERTTIFCSSIVGFDGLQADSNPLEIVCMLDLLFTEFDEVLEKYKVYKLGATDDQYMVVSGLPEECEDHASQIARMSLELLQVAKKFQIPHRPQEELSLRIGLHSGAVVAGVVGKERPQYRIFGHTVDVTREIEKTGEASRIHVSADTYNLLQRDPRFKLRPNADSSGMESTYWLYDKSDESSFLD